MVLSGVTLSFISFFTKGDVTDGVLWYTAQALTFAGSIFGVSIYFKTKLGESEHKIRQYLEEQLRKSKQENNTNTTETEETTIGPTTETTIEDITE